MTKNEAKTKWCPLNAVYTVFAIQQLGSALSKDEAVGACRCGASGCMMWRWTTYNSTTTFEPDGETPVKTRTDHGYCGLAGKP